MVTPLHIFTSRLPNNDGPFSHIFDSELTATRNIYSESGENIVRPEAQARDMAIHTAKDGDERASIVVGTADGSDAFLEGYMSPAHKGTENGVNAYDSISRGTTIWGEVYDNDNVHMDVHTHPTGIKPISTGDMLALMERTILSFRMDSICAYAGLCLVAPFVVGKRYYIVIYGLQLHPKFWTTIQARSGDDVLLEHFEDLEADLKIKKNNHGRPRKGALAMRDLLLDSGFYTEYFHLIEHDIKRKKPW